MLVNCARERSSMHTGRLGGRKARLPLWTRLGEEREADFYHKVNAGSSSFHLGVKVGNKGEKVSLPFTGKEDPLLLSGKMSLALHLGGRR